MPLELPQDDGALTIMAKESDSSRKAKIWMVKQLIKRLRYLKMIKEEGYDVSREDIEDLEEEIESDLRDLNITEAEIRIVDSLKSGFLSQRTERGKDSSGPVDITPEEFERLVESWLAEASGDMESFVVTHREDLDGRSGTYEMDVVARFNVLDGAKIKVLVECKRHKNSIKRDVVMILNQKIQEVGAHKGMIFATANFQSGAIEFAEQHGIALVTVEDGMAVYHTRSYNQQEVDPPSWVHISDYVGWVTRLNDDGNETKSVIDDNRIRPLKNWFSELGEA